MKYFSQVFVRNFKSVVLFVCICAFSLYSIAQSPSFHFVPSIDRFAGTGTAGSSGVNGPAISAMLSAPKGLVQDASGNFYLSDSANNVVKRIDARTGIITVFAGGGSSCAAATDAYGDGCPATQATLNAPDHLTFDRSGNLYIADLGNNLVREVIASTGVMVKVAGGGSPSCAGSNDTVGDGCIATEAVLSSPDGVAVDSAGNIYVSDSIKHLVRKINGSTRIIAKWAGTGQPGSATDGTVASSVRVFRPAGLRLDSAGNIYIADSWNSLIRVVSATDGKLRTVAGTYTGSASAASAGYSGDGGPATSAVLYRPTDMFPASSGNLYITDTGNNVVRSVDTNNVISTIGGGGTVCSYGDSVGNGCAAIKAKLNAPYAVIQQQDGSLIVTDTGNNQLRRLSLNNDFGSLDVNTSVGTSKILNAAAAQATTLNQIQISPAATEFNLTTLPNCTVGGSVSAGTVCGLPISFTPKFPGLRSSAVVVSEQSAKSFIGIRGIGTAPQIAYSSALISTLAGNGNAGNSNGSATSASFRGNRGLAIDLAGNIYIADTGNHLIRRIDALSGAVTTIAGTGSAGYSGDGGQATVAALSSPASVSFNPATGQLLIADTGNSVIRSLDPDGTIRTVAGNGTSGFAGDGSAATSAELNAPQGVTADYSGAIYIADTGNNRIRQVSSNGTITTIAGTGSAGNTGDQGAASSATLNAPSSLTVDLAGNLYIADTGNHSIRRMVLGSGIIDTYAGQGIAGYSGDGGAATSATLDQPQSVAVDAAGTVFIADAARHVVRAINPVSGKISTVAGTGDSGYTGDAGTGMSAHLNGPKGVGIGPSGNVIVSDTGNNVVRLLGRSTVPTLNFDPIAVGSTSAPQAITIFNSGNKPLQFSSIAVSGPFAQVTNASGDCSTSASLQAGDGCTLTIVFKPVANGPATGTLTLTDNALNAASTQIISLVSLNPSFATNTSLSITPSTSQVKYGTSIKLDTAVTALPSNTNPYTGTLVLSDGGAQLSSATISNTGTYSYSLVPTVGLHSYVANYLGDSNHGLSQSAAVPLSVIKANTTVSLQSSGTSARIGTPVVLTATVAPEIAGQPGGSITFATASGTLGTVALTGGQASLTTTSLPQGDNVIKATYSGDTNFSGSSSQSITVTIVIVPDFTLTATPSSITIPAGQSGVVNFTITPVYGYAGTISFSCGMLPANVACRFIPGTVTSNGTNTVSQAQLLITTGGASASQNITASGFGMTGLWSLLGSSTVLLFIKRRRRLSCVVIAVLCVTLVSSVCGCGNGKSVAPTASPGTSSIVVTAAGSTGNMTHASTLTLTIK